MKKYQIIIGNLLDNTITSIINHNLSYTTTVNSIVMIEEFNKLLSYDYDRNKVVAYGMIHSGISTPEKHKTPIISLENYYYSINKPPTDSSSNFLITETSRMKKISSFPKLQSK